MTYNSAPASYTETLNTNPGWDGWFMEWSTPSDVAEEPGTGTDA